MSSVDNRQKRQNIVKFPNESQSLRAGAGGAQTASVLDSHETQAYNAP
jgi:hypothetical protein